MCTVTVVASQNKIIITSNRDEKTIRPAIEPKNYLINNKNIIFPKDSKAGGTWYAVSETGSILVLLNGAAEKHEVKLPYRRSRGLIVLDLISSDSINKAWNEIDLNNIEPFTLISFETNFLSQLRWDGFKKKIIDLDILKPHIWSSSTLYPKEIRGKRANWFQEFLNKNKIISENELYDFHRNTETHNAQDGLVINRNNEMKTLSITQSVIENNKITILHHDLIEQNHFSTTFIII